MKLIQALLLTISTFALGGCHYPASTVKQGGVESRLSLAAVPAAWPFDAMEAARRQAETAKALGVPELLAVDLGDGIALKLALIPAGRFMMGSLESELDIFPPGFVRPTNESPLHEVIIRRPFYVSITKITQEQYQQIMGTNPSKFPGQNHPVDAVTWDEAADFSQRASAKTHRTVHLPTEAQWEYAARAGTATRYFFGNDENKIGEFAWYRENAKGMTHPVGEKPANAWGLFDVHGLLWEYCSDFYTDSYADAKSADPTGPASGTAHVSRGGTYGSRPPFLRSAIRVSSPSPDVTKDNLSRFGFRVAIELPQ